MTRLPWEITREMFLSLDETERLLAHLKSRRQAENRRSAGEALLDSLIIEGLLFSGLRNSEFCRLSLGDTIVRTGRSTFLVRGKDAREVHVPGAVSGLVRQYVERTRPELLQAAGESGLDAPLVLNERGRAYERTGLYRRVVRILEDAGLGARASVQLLRHTYGYLSYLATSGNLLFVQRQLGHAHPMITSIYAAFVEEPYDALAESLYTRVASPVSKVNPV